MAMPAPSLMTKPSRSRSNGRDARSGSSLRLLSAFIAENPARPSSTIAASEPPATKISASPNLIMRHDSPMELLDVAQAVTMHMFGPRNPNSIEITPLAMLLMSIGIVKAETRCGPLFINTLNWSSSVFSPPMPLLTITPKRSRFTFSRSRPLSWIDILAAAMAS